MCEPVTLSIMAASAGVGAFSAFEGAKAERSQAEFQAAVGENNATMADNSANDAILRGSEEANRARREGRKVAGTQRAVLAGNGVDVKTGVAAALQDETGYFAEADATTIRNNAARAAWGFRAEAQDYRSNAQMARAVAKSKSPGRAAALSILGSASQFAGQSFFAGK